jgi:protein TonB
VGAPPTITAAATVAAATPAAPSSPQPTAAPPPTGGPVHIEDVDTRPKRLSCSDPSWPREALEAKVSGTVVAKCTVTTAGSLSGCRIVKGLPFMDGPVLASLATCRYSPAMAKGTAVAVDIPITMRLAAP